MNTTISISHIFFFFSFFLEMIIWFQFQVNDLLKVAKTNFIVLKLLAGGHKKDSTVPPEFEFTYHKHLPVIKLN